MESKSEKIVKSKSEANNSLSLMTKEEIIAKYMTLVKELEVKEDLLERKEKTIVELEESSAVMEKILRQMPPAQTFVYQDNKFKDYLSPDFGNDLQKNIEEENELDRHQSNENSKQRYLDKITNTEFSPTDSGHFIVNNATKNKFYNEKISESNLIVTDEGYIEISKSNQQNN